MRAALNGLLVLILIYIAVYANVARAANICTPWVEPDPGSACLLSGREGLRYERTCEDTTRVCHGHASPALERLEDCEKVELCTDDDPNKITECGPWHRVSGVTCRNRESGDWEQKYARNCVVGGFEEELCSDRGPR